MDRELLWPTGGLSQEVSSAVGLIGGEFVDYDCTTAYSLLIAIIWLSFSDYASICFLLLVIIVTQSITTN